MIGKEARRDRGCGESKTVSTTQDSHARGCRQSVTTATCNGSTLFPCSMSVLVNCSEMPVFDDGASFRGLRSVGRFLEKKESKSKRVRE
jgi:hypothetical protein